MTLSETLLSDFRREAGLTRTVEPDSPAVEVDGLEVGAGGDDNLRTVTRDIDSALNRQHIPRHRDNAVEDARGANHFRAACVDTLKIAA